MNLLLSQDGLLLLKDFHEPIFLHGCENELLFTIILLEVLLGPFSELNVGVIKLCSPGDDDDFLEAATVVISYCRKQRASLPRPTASSCDDAERDRRQMFKSRLFVDHFPPFRWDDDGFLSLLHLNK